MGVCLYHTTKATVADHIMTDGFRGAATVNTRFTRTLRYPPGVFFGTVPALDDELFDGIGLFDFDAEQQAFIAIDACLPMLPDVYSWDDDTWPGTQYWGKAAMWNQFPRTRLTLDDAIRLRIEKPWFAASLKRWVQEAGDRREYGTEFHARVKRILEL
jgi:hypothetical protein